MSREQLIELLEGLLEQITLTLEDSERLNDM